MEIRQLKYFNSIIKHNSFTEAAEDFGISQSGISQQIKSLEKELGVKLFERQNRKFIVTEAGHYLYKKTVVLLNDIEVITRDVAKIGKRSGGSIYIAYLKSNTGFELQQAIYKFTQKYPNVNLNVISGTHDELCEEIKSERVDFILCDKRWVSSQDYVNYHIKDVETYVVVSENSKISKLKTVDIEDLKDFPIILIASKNQQENEQIYFRNTIGFKGVFLFVDNIQEGIMLASANQGILPLAGNIKLNISYSVKCIPLMKKGKSLIQKYYAFWKKDNSGYYIEALAEILKREFNKK